MPDRIVIYSPGALSAYGHSFDYTSGLAGGFRANGTNAAVFTLDGKLRMDDSVEIHKSADRIVVNKKGLVNSILWGIKRIIIFRRLLRKMYRESDTRPHRSKSLDDGRSGDLAAGLPGHLPERDELPVLVPPTQTATGL